MVKVKITRRVALEVPYEFYEFEASYDPAKTKGNKIIKDIEKQVVFVRKATQSNTTKEVIKETTKSPTKKKQVPNGYKLVPDIEDIHIADLKAGDKKVNIEVRLEKVGNTQTFNRDDGTAGTFCKIDVADATGKMKLTVWDEDVDLVQNTKENAWLSLQNAYVKEYKGVKELTLGRYGSLEVVYK